MKKGIAAFIAAAAIVAAMSSCSKEESKTASVEYKDGTYFAQEDAFAGSGYKYFVVLTVSDGKISDAYWGGTHTQALGDKRILSENKQYGMVKYGGAASYWYEQADAAEAWLLENQDPKAFVYKDDAGHTDKLKTDAGTAVSIHVNEFYELAEKALASPPVPAGKYKITGYVANAELPPAENGWKPVADFVVANGTIVSANINAVFAAAPKEDGSNANYFGKKPDGSPDPAKPLSKDEIGEGYGMKAYGGAKLEWNEQMALIEDYIVKNQGLPGIKEDETTDAVSGVSIHVGDVERLFNAAFGN